MQKMISSDTSLLEQGLNAAWKRQEVILNNVANVDTPGFKSSGVSFEDRLQKALNSNTSFVAKRTRDKHFDLRGSGSVRPLVVKTNDTSLRADGNNVDIEGEMTSLAKNSIYYGSMISKISSQFSRLRTAISGR